MSIFSNRVFALRIVAVVSVLALVVGACGSDDDSSDQDISQILIHIEDVLESLQTGEDAIAAGLQGARTDIGAALQRVQTSLDGVSQAVHTTDSGEDIAQVLVHIENVLETLQDGEDAIAAGLQGARAEIGVALQGVNSTMQEMITVLNQIAEAVGVGSEG